jgi:hypothetical protein
MFVGAVLVWREDGRRSAEQGLAEGEVGDEGAKNGPKKRTGCLAFRSALKMVGISSRAAVRRTDWSGQD